MTYSDILRNVHQKVLRGGSNILAHHSLRSAAKEERNWSWLNKTNSWKPGIVRHFGKFANHYYQYRQWVQVIKGCFFVFYQCLLYCFLTCPQECFGVFWGRETWTFHLHCVSLSSWHLCPIPQQQTIKEKYLLICPYGLWQLMNLPKMLNYPFKGLTTQLLVTRRWHFLETEWSTLCGAFFSCD